MILVAIKFKAAASVVFAAARALSASDLAAVAAVTAASASVF